MHIQNFESLALNGLRETALRIAEAAYDAIDTKRVIETNVRIAGGVLHVKDLSVPLGDVDRIIFVGVGKCAIDAARALEPILGARLSAGIAIGLHEETLDRVKVYAGTHPFPTAANVKATGEAIRLLSGMTPRDLVLFVISGGGSTLLCQPKGMGSEDEAKILKLLFEKGAPIGEINTLRKHLSSARGGFLSEYAYPARTVSLIFSDVPGNAVGTVASGPTVKDTTTIEDARAVLEAFGIEKETGRAVALYETPKDDRYFAHAEYVTVVSNHIALAAMAEKAEELGFVPSVRTETLSGEAKQAAEMIMRELHDTPPHAALFYGGEPTVTVKKEGKGGRELELALSALTHLREGELIMPFASDGRDNSDFAGALCDIMTVQKASAMGLDPVRYLEDNQSYRFFEEIADYLMTGSTGSNVSDLIIALKA